MALAIDVAGGHREHLLWKTRVGNVGCSFHCKRHLRNNCTLVAKRSASIKLGVSYTYPDVLKKTKFQL